MTIETTWAWRPHEWGFPVSLSLATLSLATSITAGVIDETAMRERSDLEALRRRLDEWKRRLFAAAEDYGITVTGPPKSNLDITGRGMGRTEIGKVGACHPQF